MKASAIAKKPSIKNDQQTRLDERMAEIRENYVERFTAMESAVSSFKKTGNLLTNFMDAMTADKN